MAPWCSLPRLCTHRRDVVRDAQRLPRPGTRSADCVCRRRCFLRGRCVISALFKLPVHIRRRLVTALESGLLEIPCSKMSVQSVLGIREAIDEIVDALDGLVRLGLAAPAAAAWI